MPEISSNDIREWDDERLDNEINEAYRSLFTLRFQHATRQLENYRTLRTARRTIARLRTIKRERQLQENAVETVAICFLHSYIENTNEESTAEILKCLSPELFVSTSNKISTVSVTGSSGHSVSLHTNAPFQHSTLGPSPSHSPQSSYKASPPHTPAQSTSAIHSPSQL